MGFNADDYFPPPRPKKPKKKGSSGKGTSHQVGMAVTIFGSAGLVGLLVLTYLAYGWFPILTR